MLLWNRVEWVRALSFVVAAMWVAAGAWAADSLSPFEFVEVPQRAPLSVIDSTKEESRWLQRLSISPDGAHVALSRLNGKADVWSLRGGNRGALRLPVGGTLTRTLAAVFSDPCALVVATGLEYPLTERRGGPRVGIWDCRTGGRFIPLRRAGSSHSELLVDLVALSSCRLAVAVYPGQVTVVDLASNSVRPELGRLFDSTREPLFRALPADKRAEALKSDSMRLAAPITGDRCVAYGLVNDNAERMKPWTSAKLYEFDLGTGRVRLIRALPELPIAPKDGWSSPHIAVSPARRYAAISLGDSIEGAAVLIVVDLADGGNSREFNLSDSLHAGIEGAVFLNEHELLLTTNAFGVNTDAILFDHRSGRAHTLCYTVFGGTDINLENPRAIAAHPALSLVAVSTANAVRVFRYRRKPNAPYAGVRDCVDD